MAEHIQKRYRISEFAHMAEHIQKRYRISEFETTFEQIDTPARCRSFVSDERHTKASAELIAELFGIGPTRPQRTLQVSTPRGVRSDGKLRSIRSNIGCQLYSHKSGFKTAYPIEEIDGNHVGNALTQFINNYGAPEQLTFDGAAVQTGPNEIYGCNTQI